MKPDLQGRADVAVLVKTFYDRVFVDPLIGHIFTDVAKLDLDHHMPIMCDFWETVLFRAGLYRRNALQVHLLLDRAFPLEKAHFDRWLAIWTVNVDDQFSGERAEIAKTQAQRIAGSMLRRIQGRSGSDFETLRPRPAG